MKTHVRLKQLLEEKKNRNPRISLRSIAAKMGMPPGRVSELLAGKRNLTSKHLEKFCRALKVSSDEGISLKLQLEAEKDFEEPSAYRKVFTAEQTSKLTDWKPYALMCFLQTDDYATMAQLNSNPLDQMKAISQKLSMSYTEIESLIEIMLAVNFIEWKDVLWRPTHTVASAGHSNVPSKVVQEAHHSALELAKNKLFKVDVTQRDFSFMTIAMNPEDLEKARKMIRTFRRKFAVDLEKGKKKSVYQISIQFFPISSLD
ncbi:MAG TPA: TIGR02147 family protein [Bdellovibrio sp.]|uniref:TIGR02147 family protein n=1 Tax=Bdellovibrio sp. TaxID=28201 RepID=UPI002F088795